MQTTFKRQTVTRQEILNAIQQFDSEYPDTNQYEKWLDDSKYRYAVEYNDKLYPCKYILSQATGISTTEFSGGEQTNSVFKALGFTVIKCNR
jgi:transketolase